MPQYKYAAGVRNPQQHMASQPQVAMQQVRTAHSLTVNSNKITCLLFIYIFTADHIHACSTRHDQMSCWIGRSNMWRTLSLHSNLLLPSFVTTVLCSCTSLGLTNGSEMFPPVAGSPRPRSGAPDGLHVGCCPPSGAKADAGLVKPQQHDRNGPVDKSLSQITAPVLS